MVPNALSRASRARPLASGTRWPYRSTVVVMDLCPSQRETSEMGTPSARAVLANVCRLCGIPHNRHGAVSLWLNGGVAVTEVADRAGHSVEVLLRVYAKCIDGGEEIANRRIDEALAG